MPDLNSKQNRFRQILLEILILGLTLLALISISMYKDFYSAHLINVPIQLLSFKIDALGAILPLVAGIICLTVYLKERFPLSHYIVIFLVLFVFNMGMSQVSAVGLLVKPLLIALTGSIISFTLVTALRVFKKKTIWDLRGSYYSTLLTVSSTVPIVLFVIDLIIAQVFGHVFVFIGGY